MLKEKCKKILILTVISIMMFNFIGTNVVYGYPSDDDFMSQLQQGASVNEILNNKDDTYVSGDLDAEQQAQQGNMNIIIPGSTVDANTGPVVNPSNGSSSSTSIGEDPTRELLSNKAKLDEENKIGKIIGDGLSTVADGLVGIFTYFERLKIVIIGAVFQFLGTVVGESAGSMNTGTVTLITPDDILFNKLAITDINFFNLTSFGTLSNQKSLSGDDNPIKLLKQNVANWYMTLRTMSMIILIVILIYIGIRMVLASNPESKVNYKKMFTNWLVSLALVFLLHYIIVFVINLNAVLVDMIASIGNKALAINDGFMSNYVSKLVLKSFMPLATISWGAAIVYLCLVALTFVFLIMYIKRMITIAFLVLISPIITITYSIDKAGDGKAQAFSAWMKEFLHNVLIQPFHCIIYVAFVAIAVKMLEGTGTLASAMLVIITMFFILEAENLIKQIFGINSKSTGSALATAAVLSTAYEKLKPEKKKDGNGQANGAKDRANGSKPATANGSTKPSMTAESNMNAANKVDDNERLSRMMSGGAGEDIDYDNLMGNSENKRVETWNELKTDINDKVYGKGNWEEVTDADGRNQIKVKDLNNEQLIERNNKVYGEGNWKNGINEDGYYYETELHPELSGIPMPNVKNKNPNNDEKSFKDGIKGLGKMAGKAFVDGNKATSGLAGGVIGGTLAGLSGQNIANTVGSVIVGKKIQDHLEKKGGTAYDNAIAKWEQHVKDTNIRNNERTLATAFSNFKNSESYKRDIDEYGGAQLGDDDQDIIDNLTYDYLDMSREEIEAIEDDDKRAYVQSLHAMNDIYKQNPDEYYGNIGDARIIHTVQKINRGEIQPND